MQRHWMVFCAGFAATNFLASTALPAPPSGRAVETETIIVEPEEFGDIDPGLIVPESPQLDDATPDIDSLDTDFADDDAEDPGPPPTIEYDTGKLPPPVRRLREQIVEAALTGNIEKLRPIIEANPEPPLVSFVEIDDPVEQLKSFAGDPEGREILAILIEVLDAGYVHVDVGTPNEMYVWPYFARYPLDNLSGPQMVELFKLLTAGDYEDMKIFGTYLFYRVGIAPNGVWKYFVAGD